MDIRFDYSNALKFICEQDINELSDGVSAAHQSLHNKSGEGNDYVGWVDLPLNYDSEEFERIKKTAEKIKNDSDVLLVIGIGGSYLGARAIIDALTHSFYNNLNKEKRQAPQIFFVGNNISSTYITDIIDIIEGKDISINVISKSGTTTEPAIAFRIFRSLLEKKYGRIEAAKRIYATTDKSKGALKKLADEQGYETFVIPDDIGGRYSVLTSVGLLPIAVANINIGKLMEGAKVAYNSYINPNLNENDCYKYAVIRNILYKKNKTIEILVNYEPRLRYFAEWWKQLFGESEGKENKGIYPSAVDFSTDLHSLGQYVQDGLRNIFETVINVKEVKKNIFIGQEENDLDGLNFLSGESIQHVNEKAFLGAMLAHVDGGVPNLVLEVPEINEFFIGQMVYFFEKACGISGYLLGVNPFDQPGVEAYKRNMFALLGKPGYEEEKLKFENALGVVK